MLKIHDQIVLHSLRVIDYISKIILALGYKISDKNQIFPKEKGKIDENFKAEKFMISN